MPPDGDDCDFFACGGGSLLAMGLLTRIREEAGVAIHVRQLMACPTLGAPRAMVAGSTPAREARRYR